MPEVQLKKLHLATSLELLNKKVIIDFPKNALPSRLVNSAKKILSKAELSEKERDEEEAYMYFMKYFAIIQWIQKHEDYVKNKKYYDSLLDPKNTKRILTRAEQLSQSLQRRYSLLLEAKLEENKDIQTNATPDKAEKKDDLKDKRIPLFKNLRNTDDGDGIISCHKLYSLMKEKASSFLVVDVRPKKDFQSSSIKVSSLINIPEEVLKPGLTAHKAGRELEETSRLLWARRDAYDYVIICDWTTEDQPFPSPVADLISALVNWDPGKSYKNQPVVLKGGYQLFALMYPMLISNPTSHDFSKLHISGSTQTESVKSCSNDLLNFNFPDLDTAFLATPSPDRTMEYPQVNEGVKPPSVYRDLKPTVSVSESFTDQKESPVNGMPFTVHDSHKYLPISAPLSYPSPHLESKFSEEFGATTQDKQSPKKGTPVPVIPSRELKPRELLETLKAKSKDLQEENHLLEESMKVEMEAMKKLQEVEETRKSQEATSDEATQLQLSAKEVQLREELEEQKKLLLQMERDYSLVHKQNEDLRNLLSQYFAGQLKLNDGSPLAPPAEHFSPLHKEENDALKVNENKRQQLLLEVEEMRRKRKEKEKKMKGEEEDRIKEKMKKKKETEQRTKEQLRWATERNSRDASNKGQADLPSAKTTPSKRIGGEIYTTKLRTSPRSSPVRGGSNMKRSHSALNLSQLREDASPGAPLSTPTCDRSLKPLNLPRRRNLNAARQRNFEPKYGSVAATVTGLKNLGNTCYMNSIMQCLSNTFPLAKYFFEGLYSDDLNPQSSQNGEVAEEIGAVVRALWSGQYRSIAIWDLKTVIGRYHRPFQGCDQHDSHEFLIKLMDWLHDDLNLVSAKLPKMEEQNFDDIPDYVAAEHVMDALQERDDSIVRNLFHGLHRSVIVCHTCGNRSLTFEPFSVLTVSFTNESRCSLKDMLADFYSESRIEYKCSRCCRVRNCTRKLNIWTIPPILIIHLNRFEHDVLTRKKQNFVDFPLENLNLTDYTVARNRFLSYDLYGVSNHYGTIDGGHYTAFCKSPQRTWHKFDDHEVYDLPRESVRTSAAYILFYESSHM